MNSGKEENKFEKSQRIRKALFPIKFCKFFYYSISLFYWHFDFCDAKIGMPQKGLNPPPHKAAEDTKICFRNPVIQKQRF